MMAGQLQRRAAAADVARQAAEDTVYAKLDAYTPNLQAALPRGFPGGVARFARIVRTAVSSNPMLLQCEPRSVVAGAIQSAQLGLMPNLMGQCWLIPRRVNGVWTAVWQMGYKGLIDLAARADVHVRADTVRHGDYYLEEGGLEPRLVHYKAGRGHPLAQAPARGEPFLWYAIAESVLWSVPRFAALDAEEVAKFREASDADTEGKHSPWVKWPDEMAMSKAIRVGLRYVRVSVDFDRAARHDDTVLDLEEVLALANDEEQDTARAAGEPDATPTAPQLEQAAGAPVEVLDATTKDTAR